MKTLRIEHIEIIRHDEESSVILFVPRFYDYRPTNGFSVIGSKET